MNAEELSLEYVIVGPRGSGKTLLLTHFSVEKLQHAWAVNKYRELSGKSYAYKRHKTKVWSNYPVRCHVKLPTSPRVTILSTIDLDIERLITWQPEFRDGYIIYDEIDQDADRQDWMAQLPKLLVKGIKLMRHRNMSMLSSLQFVDELNIRLYKQADVVIQCRDKAFTGWGREVGLRPGEVMNTTFIDKSGILTGYSFDENHQRYPMEFFGKRYWGAYETTHEFDVLRPKYRVKIPVREIRNEEDVAEEEKNKQLVYTTVLYFMHDFAGKRIKSTEFSDKLLEFGCTMNKNNWGGMLRQMGIEGTLYQGIKRYDFSNVELDGVLA